MDRSPTFSKVSIIIFRTCLLLTNLVALIVGGLLFIPNYKTLIFFRLIQGACVGVMTSVPPMTIREMVPVELSGTLGSLVQINVVFGIFIAYFMIYCLKKITGDLTCQSYW